MRRPLDQRYSEIPANGRVLDVGCMGFAQVARGKAVGRADLRHFGVDFVEPVDQPPAGYTFRRADLSVDPIPFEDDYFDFVVASHVVEHIRDPVRLIQECVRVCRPGGVIYIEAPSERSLLLPSMPFRWDRFHSLSFYDDPTHISRPWTPQAFYRLASLMGCVAEEALHLVSWPHRLLAPLLIPLALLRRDSRNLEYWAWLIVGWSCCVVIRKPEILRGAPTLGYYVPKDR